MHRQRLLTALIVGPILLALLLWGGHIAFDILLAGATILCLREFFSMSFPKDTDAQVVGILAGMLPVLGVILFHEPLYVLGGLYLVALVSLLFFLVTYSRWDNCFQNWAVLFLGASYIGICFAHFGMLRHLLLGKEFVLFLLVVIFAGDIGAYYVGKGMGKKKLCPNISKGKTVAGAMGGIVSNAVAALIMWFVMLRQLDPRIIVPLAIVTGAIGQIGDLAESVIKRSSGVKDSGTMLPGHGGVFDRLDAVMLAAPFFYWALHLLGIYLNRFGNPMGLYHVL